MKTILFFSFLFISYLTNAQVLVDGVDVNKVEGVEYLEIVGQATILSGKQKIFIDYGQFGAAYGGTKFGKIQGPDGKSKKFNSTIDALNFMYKNGWEYVNNYAITTQSQNVYHYLLRKKGE